jgi:hypothetical protein
MADEDRTEDRDEDEELEFKELRFMEEEEAEELLEKKGWMHARFVYEVQQADADTVQAALKKIVATLRAQDHVEVAEVKYTSVEDIGNNVHSMIGDVGVYARGLDVLMLLVLNITPSTVILIEPESRELSINEMQNILADVGSMMEHMANENIQLHIKLDGLARGKMLEPARDQ